jgi:hypothetical protein
MEELGYDHGTVDFEAVVILGMPWSLILGQFSMLSNIGIVIRRIRIEEATSHQFPHIPVQLVGATFERHVYRATR